MMCVACGCNMMWMDMAEISNRWKAVFALNTVVAPSSHHSVLNEIKKRSI